MAIEIDGGVTRRYYHTFTDDDGNSYRWEIHQDGYDSTVDETEVLSASTRTHCVTRWAGASDDEFSPILGSETTITFFEDDDDPVVDALIDNVSSSEEQFAIVIKDSDTATVRWVGFVDYEDVRRPEDGLVSLSITARDGLGRLEDKYYVSNTATGALYEGRATVTSIIATLLNQIGWGLDFYIATEIYPAPYGSDEPLSVNDNPLDNLYVERLLFAAVVEGETDVWGRKIPENAPIKSIEVLKAILERFCLRIFQADGAWHIYQVNQYYITTEDLGTSLQRAQKFRRWKYNSSGAYQDDEVFTHAVTISNDQVKRSVANASLAKTYSAAQITYNHGAIRLIRQPGFDSVAFQIRDFPNYGESDQWITNDDSKSLGIQFGQDALKDGAWKVFDLDGVDWTEKTGYVSIFGGWANATGTGADTVDEAIGDYKVYQTTKSVIPSGTNIRAVLRAFLINQNNSTYLHGDFNYALPIQIKINSATPKYWTKGVSADSWSTTPNWVLMENPTPGQGIINFSNDLPVTDVSGTITISLGGPFDASEYNDQTDSRFDDISAVVYDHADLVYILDDGTYNAEATSVINYIDRDVPKIKQIDTKIGDGPTNLSLGALTFDSDGIKATGAWAEGATAAQGSPTDTLNNLHSRIILRGTNEPRNKHEAQYFDAGQILWPLYSIRRSSQNYIAWDIDYDWQAAVTAGTWCEVRQFGFTDDLVTGIDSGAGSANWNSSYDRSGFLLSRLSKAFFSDTARRITRTTAYIEEGTDATYPQTIAVEAIPDALLDVGDYINIIAPDLSFYTVGIGATQLPGDTTLTIVDPDDPDVNFDFPEGVPYPASIFLADKSVMTLARLGEQGFAVTVLGEVIGRLDGNQGPFVAGDSITVKNWAVTMEAGAKVYLAEEEGSADQQRVELEIYGDAALTEPVYKGATTIYTATPSDGLSFFDDYRFVPKGSVPRSDFQITANEISAYVGSPGDKIGTLFSVVWGPDIGSPFTSNTYISISGNTENIKQNDTLLIYTRDGSVVKVTAKDNSSTPTSAFRLSDGDGDLTDVIAAGDAVASGSVIGMRIDSNDIEFTANQVTSSNYSAGSAGWALFNSGSAEFNNITARGTIIVGGGSDGASNFSDFLLENIGGNVDDIDDGTDFKRWPVTGSPPSSLTNPGSTGLYIGSNFMGYFAIGSPGEWRTYMDSSGNFYLGGTSGKLTWNNDTDTLTVTGQISIESGSTGYDNIGDGINFKKWPATGAPPTAAGTPTTSGLYLGSDYMGYFSAGSPGEWTTYMANNGDFYLGGTSGSLVWDASEDSLTISGDITATGTLTGGTVIMGESVFGAGKHGISIDTNNYWKLDTTPSDPDQDIVTFAVGDGTNGIVWNGSSLSVTGSISATGTLTGGGIVFGNNAFSAGIHGININANNYWKLDTTPEDPDPDVITFAVGNGTSGVTWNGTALTVTGAINATSGSISGALTLGASGKFETSGYSSGTGTQITSTRVETKGTGGKYGGLEAGELDINNALNFTEITATSIRMGLFIGGNTVDINVTDLTFDFGIIGLDGNGDGEITVNGNTVFHAGNIGDGLTIDSGNLVTDISATSGGGGAIGGGDKLTLTDKNGNTVLVKCDIV